MIPLHVIFHSRKTYIPHRPLATTKLNTNTLHIPPSSNAQRLPTNIAHQRTNNRQNRTRSLRRRPRPAERDILESALSLALLPSFLLLRNSQRNLNTIRRGHKSALFLRSRQTRRNMSERYGVSSHAERRAPFFRDGLCEAYDAGFGESVVCLAGVAVEPRG
jgi:hypothetical protein